MKIYDNIIIGGGASGLMCAARIKGKTLLLEKSKNIGNKILASGGGKCNFSNLNISSDNYFSHNPHFVKSALSRFNTEDFLEILKQYNIKWEEREHGQLFAFSSRDILDMLTEEVLKNNVEILVNKEVVDIEKNNDNFIIVTLNEKFYAKNIIVAAGGISFPSLGVSKIGFNIAKKFNINVYPLKPALCSLNYKEELHNEFKELSGISLKIKIFQNKKAFTDQLLFTHKGLSGPGALQMSVYFNETIPVKVNFLPDTDVTAMLEESKKLNITPAKLFQNYLPKKLLKTLFEKHDFSLANATSQQINTIVNRIVKCEFFCKLASFEKAEVMSGGVDTEKISSQSMESKEVKGLYFIGEALDVIGQLGGYNLHWAWASANACALNLKNGEVI